MSDTSKTDALEHGFYGVPDHSDDLDYHSFLQRMTHHARQLERELASTQRMLADCYEAQRIGAQYAAPQASNGSPQGSGVGQRQTAPLLGEVAESDNAPAAVAAPWTDWQNPVMKGYRMECCDCRLVHEVEFRVGKVTELHADGKGWEGELMPDGEYRVQMRLRRG